MCGDIVLCAAVCCAVLSLSVALWSTVADLSCRTYCQRNEECKFKPSLLRLLLLLLLLLLPPLK